MPVIMVLIESGGLHASAWLALLVTYLSDSNGQFVALDTITPLVVCHPVLIRVPVAWLTFLHSLHNFQGIVYSLIIIQIDIYADASWRSVQPAAHSSYAMHPVGITVTTHRAIYTDRNNSYGSTKTKDLESAIGGPA